jgi:L-threonate 2-dehydrogenase
MSETVGVIGLGSMGSAMAANLVKAGFTVVGHDIERDRVQTFTAAGGRAAGSNAAVAEAAELVITSLPSAAALAAVTDDLAEAAGAGHVVAETSTLPLDVKERARDALATTGATLLDCPLSGTGKQAITGDLVVYASGDADAIARCVPMFRGFARGHYELGAFGAGSKMKYIANHLVTIHNVAAAEAFTLARKAGLDPQVVLDAVSDGAGTSRMLEVRWPSMISRDYGEGIRSRVYLKDIAIIGAFAAALDVPVPMFSAAVPFYAALVAQGHGDEDTAAVAEVLQRLAGLD